MQNEGLGLITNAKTGMAVSLTINMRPDIDKTVAEFFASQFCRIFQVDSVLILSDDSTPPVLVNADGVVTPKFTASEIFRKIEQE